uniref:Ste24 endopeptidase n=1 Tax=Zea mays TaxID=4577 RepID=A0A804P1S8_MAIZE
MNLQLLNTEAPDLYIRQNPVPNAYTLAINSKKPFIVVHTSLVELLTPRELHTIVYSKQTHRLVVLAHELGHLKCDHGVWLTFANILTMGAYTVPEVVISVLMKLAGGCPSLADKLNVDAFLEQARSYDKAASNPVGWYIRELSHPLPVMRAREIDEWSRSQEYKTLMQKMFQMGLNRQQHGNYVIARRSIQFISTAKNTVVSLALICSFSWMRSHLGLEGDAKPETVPEETVLAVADILRHSTALRVSEDGKKVGRSKELLKPDEVIEQVDSRTVAASPLPYNVKLEEVESFFAQCGKMFIDLAMKPQRVGDADGESRSAAAQSAPPPRAETHGTNQWSRGEVRALLQLGDPLGWLPLRRPIGMVAAARWIAKLSGPCLAQALQMYPDFKIKVVGHSLGGGTAALLTYVLREQKEFASTTCLAFAPAACMTWKLAESGVHFITTVINGADLVPTFSAALVDDLGSEVTASAWLNDLRHQIEQTRILSTFYRSASALGSRLPSMANAKARVAGAGAILRPVSTGTHVTFKASFVTPSSGSLVVFEFYTPAALSMASSDNILMARL